MAFTAFKNNTSTELHPLKEPFKPILLSDDFFKHIDEELIKMDIDLLTKYHSKDYIITPMVGFDPRYWNPTIDADVYVRTKREMLQNFAFPSPNYPLPTEYYFDGEYYFNRDYKESFNTIPEFPEEPLANYCFDFWDTQLMDCKTTWDK